MEGWLLYTSGILCKSKESPPSNVDPKMLDKGFGSTKHMTSYRAAF